MINTNITNEQLIANEMNMKWKPTVEGSDMHTCHILPPSEIDLGLCLAVFAGSGGNYSFHRIGWKGRIWQPCKCPRGTRYVNVDRGLAKS